MKERSPGGPETETVICYNAGDVASTEISGWGEFIGQKLRADVAKDVNHW